ncbi:MAG: TatD family hydrolase [Candidatus Hydrothermarchaeales archaeon]
MIPPYIDAHIHADVRSFEDFGKMAQAGIEKAVTCAHDVYRMSTKEVYLDHYDRLLRTETKRAREAGLELFVALGVHPEAIPRDVDHLIEELPNVLDNEYVVAIGETGLDESTEKEIGVLKAQMELSIKKDLPIIVHTPTKGKKEALQEILRLIETTMIDPFKVLVDHLNTETVPMVIDSGVYMGLSIQPPSKIDRNEAASIIEGHGSSRFMISSDMSSKKSDPLALPRTALELEKRGVSKDWIKKVCHDNAASFYNI